MRLRIELRLLRRLLMMRLEKIKEIEDDGNGRRWKGEWVKVRWT